MLIHQNSNQHHSFYVASMKKEVAMKRAKRSKDNRAYKLGYNQGVHGHPKEICPFQTAVDKRGQWMSGWRNGHAAFVAGYRIPTDLIS